MIVRRHTKDLLIAFKRLSNSNKSPALGLAIVAETKIGIKNYNQKIENPLFREITSAFQEMVDNNWIETIDITDKQPKRDFYFEYKESIIKIGGTYSSNIEQMKKFLSKPWPLGDHWSRLTTKGEQIAKRLTSSWWEKVGYAIKDNAKPIIHAVIGVLIASFLIFVIKWITSMFK